MRRAGHALVLGLLILVLVVLNDSAGSQSRSPCDYRDLAHHIKRMFAIKAGPGVDMDVLFANEKNQMLATFPHSTGLEGEATWRRVPVCA